MPGQPEIDVMRAAIEINALRVAEIAALRRDRDSWRERCLRLEAGVEPLAHQVARRVHDGADGRGCLDGTASRAEKS